MDDRPLHPQPHTLHLFPVTPYAHRASPQASEAPASEDGLAATVKEAISRLMDVVVRLLGVTGGGGGGGEPKGKKKSSKSKSKSSKRGSKASGGGGFTEAFEAKYGER